MNTKKIRTIQIIIYSILGLLFLIVKMITPAVYFFLAALVIWFVGIKYGSIYAAFKNMQKNDIERTKKLFNETKNPDKLSKSYKGYYYWILAYIKTTENDLGSAAENYYKALEFGVRTNNDTALLHFNLALFHFLANQIKEGNNHLQKAKVLKPKELLIEKINQLEDVINTDSDVSKSISDYLVNEYPMK